MVMRVFLVDMKSGERRRKTGRLHSGESGACSCEIPRRAVLHVPSTLTMKSPRMRRPEEKCACTAEGESSVWKEESS